MSPAAAQAGVIHVDIDATGANDGTSWANAYTDLQDALADPNLTSDPIWVAEGTYTPHATDRAVAFSIPDAAQVFGGFDGTETSLTERQPELHETVLSGDLAGDDQTGGTNAENSYTVVDVSGSTSSRVDGFTIAYGHSNGPTPGFLQSRIQVDGPAVFGENGPGVLLANLTIRDNTGGVGTVGAVSFEVGSPTIAAVRFDGNNSSGLGLLGSDATVVNTVFTSDGGGIQAGPSLAGSPGTATLSNVTLAAVGSINSTGPVTVDNSIIASGAEITGGNVTYTSSNVRGSGGSGAWAPAFGSDGGDNIDLDPQFLDAGIDNYHLLPSSPSIESGSDALTVADVFDLDDDGDTTEATPDADRQTRIQGTVDQGAYEGACRSRAFVDIDATGADDGSSWADAYPQLSAAIVDARRCEAGEIWVAEGTYKPTPGSNRNTSFILPPDVQIYGGFTGIEVSLDERDPLVNTTLLSGEIGVVGSLVDNSYHVVRSQHANNNSRLDGFKISGGNANGSGSNSRGGGIQIEDGSEPVLANLTVSGNSGQANAGGISLTGAGTRPIIISSVIRQNSTQGDGGNLRIGNGVDARIVNTVIANGSAFRGGGVYDQSSTTRFYNVTLDGNTATNGDDAIQVTAGSDIRFDNSIVWDVSSSFAPAGTITFRSSNVENSGGSGSWNTSFGVDGGDNIDIEPLFAGPYDQRLLGPSPSIDAGDQTLAPADLFDVDDDGDVAEPTPDAARGERLLGGDIDQGAYEGTGCPVGPIRVDWSSTSGSPDGSSWSSAFPDLVDGLTVASSCGPVDIWVAKGTYVPSATGDRTATFELEDDVRLFGGFRGDETSLDQRDPEVYVTVLSGDLDGDDTGPVLETEPSRSDNSLTVVRLSGQSSRLDGVTVTAGNNDDTGDIGASAVDIIGDDTVVANTVVTANAGDAGSNVIEAPASTGVTVVSSRVIDNDGQAFLASLAGSGTLVNTEFIRNGSVNIGGNSSYSATQLTLVANSLSTATAGSSLDIDNSILRGGSVTNSGSLTWRYSNVEGSGGSGGSWVATFGTDGGNNIDADPLFSDPSHDRYRLGAGSPSIDAGLVGLVPADSTDVDDDGDTSEATPDRLRLPRIVGTDVDQGAHEGVCKVVVHVDAAATGNDDGKSFADAYTDLPQALTDAARCGSEVWVAEGTYVPDRGSGDRAVAFHLSSGVAIYGGFSGSETNRNDRDPAANPVILSGDLANDDGGGSTSENSFTVVAVDGVDATGVLDGVFIKGGNSNGAGFLEQRGGGVVVRGGNPTLANLFVVGNESTNRGGGLYLRDTAATLTNIVATNNTSGAAGGGLWIGVGSTVTATNLLVAENSAVDGGGINLAAGTSTIVNATIVDNDATGSGAGLRASDGTHSVVNSIVHGNAGTSPTSVGLDGGSVTWAYSNIFGSGGSTAWSSTYGTDGGNNVDVSPPGFVDGANDDYRLEATSALIDSADAGALPVDIADLDRDGDTAEPVSEDLQGNTRVVGVAADMGAYEGAGVCPNPLRVYVDATSSPPHTGTSWATAYDDLQVALGVAATCPGLEIWVADGEYQPTTGTDRSVSFIVPSGTRMYGGFAGGEGSLLDRDPAMNQARLTGDLDGQEDKADNSFHVVTLDNAGPGTIVDGFTIVWGNADGAADDGGGGGIRVDDGSPTLANLTLTANHGTSGGAVLINGGSAELVRSVLRDNTASVHAGGIRIEGGADVDIVNSQITRNSVDVANAAGLDVRASNVDLVNVTVASNVAPISATPRIGIYYDGSSSGDLRNVIAHDNTVSNGNFRIGSTAVTTSWSNIGGSGAPGSWNTTNHGTDGGNNIDSDPLFADVVGGDWSLLGSSPSVDAGTQLGVPTDLNDLDADGDTAELAPPLAAGQRVENSDIDHGSFEYPACPSVLHVDLDATGANNGSSWSDAFDELRDALIAAGNCQGSEIWVAEGTYLPTGTTDRTVAFSPIDGVGIYGGFDGTETARTDRDATANATILSGDLAGDDSATLGDTDAADRDDNSLTVVDASANDESAILDGFVISGGNADGAPSGINSPEWMGGGVYVDGGAATLTNNVVRQNTAQWGGGIALVGSGSADLSGSTIEENSADINGGGLVVRGTTVTLTDLAVESNEGGINGGGIQVYDADVTLRRVEIRQNVVPGTFNAYGGGMDVLSSNSGTASAVIIDSAILLNTAPSGGGVAVRQEGGLITDLELTVVSSALIANASTDSAGGGVFAADADVMLVNSGMALNDAETNGGAINADGGNVTISNSTIASNTATGLNGVRLFGSSGVVDNTILDDSVNFASATVTVSNSLVRGSGGSGGAWTFGGDGGGNIDADPLFVDALGGDLHLQAGSPAIDAGENAATIADAFDVDEDGNLLEATPDLDLLPRIAGASVDMGAYEAPEGPSPGLTVLGSPCVIYDTNAAGESPFVGGEVRTVQVTGALSGQGGAASCVPAGASSVVFRISSIDPLTEGNLLLTPAGVAATGSAGVVNYGAANGLDNANTVTVPVSASGAVDIGANTGPGGAVPTTDVRLVAVGYYSPDVDPDLKYFPVNPCAVADSRTNQGASDDFDGPGDDGLWPVGSAFPDIDVVGSFDLGQGGGNGAAGCGVPSTADAVMVNVVAVNMEGGSGYLSVGTGGADPVDEATTPFAVLSPKMNNGATTIVNVGPGGTVAVDIDGDVGASTMIRVEILGYYDNDVAGLDFTDVTPCAVFDTRSGQGAAGTFEGLRQHGVIHTTTYQVAGDDIDADQGGIVDSGDGTGSCEVPDDAEAVLINLEGVNAVREGNFWVSAAGTTTTGGVLNFNNVVPKMNNANAVVVPLNAAGELALEINAGNFTPIGTDVAHARGVILGYYN